MYGKAFKIGETKRKRIPILFQEAGEKYPDWTDIYLLTGHLFDEMMRTGNEAPTLSLLLHFAKTDFENQHIYAHTNLIMHAFYPKTQINDSHKYFIPVKMTIVQGEHCKLKDKPEN